MDIKDRLKEIRDHAKMGQTNFEKYTGISGGYFSKVKSSIGSDTILKIVDKFPEINIEWLITGNGEMLKPQQSGGINNSYGGEFTGSSFVGGNNSGNNVKGTGNIVGNKIGNVHGNIKGNHNNVGIIPADCEKQLMKAQAEVDYLRKELKSLKEQLKQAVSDKERALGMLEKALNR